MKQKLMRRDDLYSTRQERAKAFGIAERFERFKAFLVEYEKTHEYPRSDASGDLSFIPTGMDVLGEVFPRLGIKDSDCFADLGSGAGDVVLFAAAVLGVKHAVGYEVNDERMAYSRDLRDAMVSEGLIQKGQVDIVDRSFLKESLSGFDCIYYFLHGTGDSNERILAEQLSSPDMKKEARVILHSHISVGPEIPAPFNSLIKSGLYEGIETGDPKVMLLQKK